jgi:hypothetical protein
VYGAWVAAAHHSQFATRTGVPGHRDFYLVAVRLAWPLGGGQNDSSTIRSTFFTDLVPIAVSTDMPEYIWTQRCRPDSACPGAQPIPHTAYGIGLSPLGWSLSVGSSRVRLTLEASGGGLWFSRRIPDPAATRFNFTASAGPALDLHLGAGEMLHIGYLWHHTSNGGTGLVNPGLNSGILCVGVLWRRS